MPPGERPLRRPMCSPPTGARPARAPTPGRRPRPGWSSRTSRPAGCGAVVRRREGRRRAGRRSSRTGAAAARAFPLGPGFLLDGAPVRADPADRGRPGRRRPPPAAHRQRLAWPSRARGPASPAARGSSSRAGTTPSWSRRSGATTCGSRASWSRCSTASTTSAARPRFGPGPGRRWACSSTTWCRAARRAGSSAAARGSAATRRTCSSSATRTSTCGRRCGPSGSASRRGRSSRAGSQWKQGICAALGWPHAHPGRHRRGAGGGSSAGAQLRRPRAGLLARVEELIDFVTAPGE